ncbi:S-adenosyl-L-methionine-dependent methyltransferase [Artomyces pyxidatus]|uniref:S-adenosyl-L-methionine-dependent methyltransferase n=1 Tax=Artomyces pyxidatus TaxID=48021 RepID=A0ACB8T3Z1_9AGAM|nr:S-adenosyl-L-methionine-dependent methyltransferase [Artomyces pyxidatus]
MVGVVLDLAKAGFAEGTNELYDRARPSYPSEALSYIREAIHTSEPVQIVEIGSGTGLFTRALLSHPEWNSIAYLKAIEPSEGMRNVFSKSVSDPRVTVEEGFFDQVPVEDGTADLIVIAQAFHWCPDHNTAAVEFARILKPGGVVALVWNLPDKDAAQWLADVRGRIDQLQPGAARHFELSLWRQIFDTSPYKKFFGDPQEHTWSYTLHGSLDIVTDRALSTSFVAIQPEDVKAQVREDIRQIVERGEGKKWVDESKGLFEYPYKTAVVTFRKQ